MPSSELDLDTGFTRHFAHPTNLSSQYAAYRIVTPGTEPDTGTTDEIMEDAMEFGMELLFDFLNDKIIK